MILTCGEAVIDMLPAELADGASGFRPVTGGAAVNCAIALSRLGQSVGFFGGMSNDTFGQFLMQEMQREGVDLSRISPVDQPSTLAFVHPAGESQGFSFFDTDSAGRSLAVTMLPDLTGVQALVFGGISLIHRPAAGAFEALMQMAGHDRLILIDPNIRPALIGEEEAGYRERLQRMMAMADIIKLSDEDIDWLHPDPPEHMLTGRAALVIHSHGADGATLYARHGSQHIPTSPVEVVDSVGAGDTLVAGLLASLFEQGITTPAQLARTDMGTLNRALAYGIRAATYSVTRAGATPPTRKDLA